MKLNITSNILTFGMLLSDRDRKHRAFTFFLCLLSLSRHVDPLTTFRHSIFHLLAHTWCSCFCFCLGLSDCRHCLRRVCSKHFTKTESGYKICTECQESGVEVDPDAGEVREDDDDDEEEDEEEEDTKEGGKKS